MAERQEHQPGTHAPVTGHYEELNVFGSPTGTVEYVREGERLPDAVTTGQRCTRDFFRVNRVEVQEEPT
jgi:hypothetical protein